MAHGCTYRLSKSICYRQGTSFLGYTTLLVQYTHLELLFGQNQYVNNLKFAVWRLANKPGPLYPLSFPFIALGLEALIKKKFLKKRQPSSVQRKLLQMRYPGRDSQRAQTGLIKP